jgi:hypothetical protein
LPAKWYENLAGRDHFVTEVERQQETGTGPLVVLRDVKELKFNLAPGPLGAMLQDRAAAK